MAVEKVEYELSLRDLLTRKLEEADLKAKTLETSIGGINAALGAVGVVLGGVAIGAFITDAVEAFNESEQASAQLDATLRSTANAANLNREALDAQSAALMNNSLFDDDAITGAQALLATFTEVKDKIFMEATPAIVDMATKMGTDLNSAAIQVGKALNDPIRGINQLHRVGVSFTSAQEALVKKLAATGDVAGAQKVILSELEKEFGGSAKAAAEAGTGGFTVLRNRLGNVKESIGGLALSVINQLLPGLNSMAAMLEYGVSKVKDLRDWMVENKKEIKDISIAVVAGVGAMAGAYAIYNIQQKAVVAWETLKVMWMNRAVIAENMLTVAQWALNAAMNANPIGIIVTALGALVAAMVYAYEKSQTFHAMLWALWYTVKTVGSLIGEAFMGVGKIILGILVPNVDMIKRGWQDLTDVAINSGKRIAGSWKQGWDAGVKDFVDGQKVDAPKPKTATPLASPLAKPTNDIADSGKMPTSSKNAGGTKIVTVNVQIGQLIGEYNSVSTTIQESSSKLKQAAVEALLSAINDSQIVGGV